VAPHVLKDHIIFMAMQSRIFGLLDAEDKGKIIFENFDK
jgi:hypothetical protein